MLASSLQLSFNSTDTPCTQFPSSICFLMKDDGLAIHILSPPHLISAQQDGHRKTWHVGHNQWERLWVFWVLEEIWCGKTIFKVEIFLGREAQLLSLVSSRIQAVPEGNFFIILSYPEAKSDTQKLSNQMYFKRLWKLPLEFNHRLKVMKGSHFPYAAI